MALHYPLPPPPKQLELDLKLDAESEAFLAGLLARSPRRPFDTFIIGKLREFWNATATEE
jgi:hypothetical protein